LKSSCNIMLRRQTVWTVMKDMWFYPRDVFSSRCICTGDTPSPDFLEVRGLFHTRESIHVTRMRAEFKVLCYLSRKFNYQVIADKSTVAHWMLKKRYNHAVLWSSVQIKSECSSDMIYVRQIPSLGEEEEWQG